MKDIFQQVIDETQDEALKQKAIEARKAIQAHVDAIVDLGYPPDSISCYTEEIPMDDPEVEMRGGMTIIFTCLVDDTEFDIPVDMRYEEFLAEIKENVMSD